MMPEAAASAEPMPNVRAMMLSTRTPRRRVVSISFEMARMARPGLVRYTTYKSTATSTMVMIGTKAVSGRMRKPPICHSETSHSGCNTGRG